MIFRISIEYKKPHYIFIIEQFSCSRYLTNFYWLMKTIILWNFCQIFICIIPYTLNKFVQWCKVSCKYCFFQCSMNDKRCLVRYFSFFALEIGTTITLNHSREEFNRDFEFTRYMELRFGLFLLIRLWIRENDHLKDIQQLKFTCMNKFNENWWAIFNLRNNMTSCLVKFRLKRICFPFFYFFDIWLLSFSYTCFFGDFQNNSLRQRRILFVRLICSMAFNTDF